MSGIQYGVAARNARLSGLSTSIGASSNFKFYTGAMPANNAAARTGTLLGTVPGGSAPFSAPSAGAMSLASTINAASAASGFMGYYSILDGSSVCHVQGLCSQPYANSLTVGLNQQIHVGSNVYKATTAGVTAGSGTGPTGTGTGITDGTAVFAYVGPVGMTFDSTSVTSPQTIVVSGFTITDPNG